MAHPLVSKHRADTTFNGVLLIGAGILFFTNSWWPWLLLVLGGALALRQYLRGRIYDTCLTVIIFGVLFAQAFFDWKLSFLIPVLFTLAGIFLLFYEWVIRRDRVGEEALDDQNKEIEDADSSK